MTGPNSLHLPPPGVCIFFVSWFFRCPKTGEKTPRTPKTNNKLKYKEPKTQIPKKTKTQKHMTGPNSPHLPPSPWGIQSYYVWVSCFNVCFFGFCML